MSSLLFHQEVGCGGKCDPYIMIYSLRFNCYDLFPFLLRLSKWLTFYFYRGAVLGEGINYLAPYIMVKFSYDSKVKTREMAYH